MRLFRSFKCAFLGILYCVNNERHMRIHTAAALYVFAFSPFFSLSKDEYLLLTLTICVVLALETINTSVEELTNLSSASYNPLAKLAKDIAAGAVLLAAVFAVIIGILLFWDTQAFLNIIAFMFDPIWHFIVFAILTAIIMTYVVLGPRGIYEKWLILKTHRSK